MQTLDSYDSAANNIITDLSARIELITTDNIKMSGLSNINYSLSCHYIVYRIDNLLNGKYYIGQHTTESDPTDDYMGSGDLIIKAKAKYGIENFMKTILFDFETFDEMNRKEIELVQLSNCYPQDPMSYNLKKGGSGMTDSQRSYNSKDSSGRRWMKNENLQVSHFVKISEIPLYELSGYTLGRIIDQSGDKNPIHNHVFTDEQRAKKSRRLKRSWDNGTMVHSSKLMTPETYQQWCQNISKSNKGKKHKQYRKCRNTKNNSYDDEAM